MINSSLITNFKQECDRPPPQFAQVTHIVALTNQQNPQKIEHLRLRDRQIINNSNFHISALLN